MQCMLCVGGDDEVLALCSVCCVLQSVGGDDDGVLALCSVCCVLQSVGDDDDEVLALSGFYPVGGSFPSNVPPKYVACSTGPYPVLDTGGFFFAK